MNNSCSAPEYISPFFLPQSLHFPLPAPSSIPSSLSFISACFISMLWLYSFVAKSPCNTRIHAMTGGLGILMVPHEFEVWLCVDHPISCATQIDPFCFTYSEVDGVFVPWATNSSLRLEKMASTRRMIPNRNRHYSKLSPTHQMTETSGENDIFFTEFTRMWIDRVCGVCFVCECVCVNAQTYTPINNHQLPGMSVLRRSRSRWRSAWSILNPSRSIFPKRNTTRRQKRF